MTDFSSQPQRPRYASHERPRGVEGSARYRASDNARVARPTHARDHAVQGRDQARGRVRERASEQGRAHASSRVASRGRERGAAKASPAQAVVGWCSSHLMLCIVVGVVVVVLGALYSPAKALYGARRTNAVLAQRLDAATSSAQTLQSEVDSLMTREGIEDEARRRGYVLKRVFFAQGVAQHRAAAKIQPAVQARAAQLHRQRRHDQHRRHD